MDLAASIVIARPVEVVFAYISNNEHDSQWRAGIIEMTQTPSGRTQIGTKTREVARFFGKKRVTPAEITHVAIIPRFSVDPLGLMHSWRRCSSYSGYQPRHVSPQVG